MTNFNAASQDEPSQDTIYISNESEDHGGDEGDCGRDEGVTEIVTKDEVVVVLVLNL